MSPRTLPPRPKELTRYVVVNVGVHAGPYTEAFGIVYTVGPAAEQAELLASKRWRVSKRQVLAVPWDDATVQQRQAAVDAERRHLQQLAIALPAS